MGGTLPELFRFSRRKEEEMRIRKVQLPLPLSSAPAPNPLPASYTSAELHECPHLPSECFVNAVTGSKAHIFISNWEHAILSVGVGGVLHIDI